MYVNLVDKKFYMKPNLLFVYILYTFSMSHLNSIELSSLLHGLLLLYLSFRLIFFLRLPNGHTKPPLYLRRSKDSIEKEIESRATICQLDCSRYNGSPGGASHGHYQNSISDDAG